MNTVLFTGVVVYLVLTGWTRRKNLKDSESWDENTGKQPVLFNVDVVYANGKMNSYVPAKHLNWSTDQRNPIIRFRKSVKGIKQEF